MTTLIRPRFDTIPECLTKLRQWILWRKIIRDGKEVKLPWSVYDNPASSTDPETWHDFECAVIRYDATRHAGIGFVFADGDGFAGVDLDSCRHPESGEIADWAKRWIDKAGDCYAEVSPSGTGVKIWVRSELKLDKGRNWKINEQPMIPGKKPGVEMYTHGRYFAVTGFILKGFA